MFAFTRICHNLSEISPVTEIVDCCIIASFTYFQQLPELRTYLFERVYESVPISKEYINIKTNLPDAPRYKVTL